MKQYRKRLNMLIQGFKEVYAIDARILYVLLIDGLVNAIFPFISLLFTSMILNQLIVEASFDKLIPIISMALGTGFLTTLISNGLRHYRETIRAIALDKKNVRLNKESMFMDYEYIENQKVHELRSHLEIAELTGGRGLYALFFIEGLIKQFVTLIISIVLISNLFLSRVANQSPFKFIDHPLIVVLFIATFILYFKYSSILYQKVMIILSKVMQEGEKGNNIFGFVLGQLFNYQSGKEIRVYHQQALYKKVFMDMGATANKASRSMEKSENKNTLILQSLIHVLLGIGFLFVALKMLGGAIDPGEIVIYTGAFSNFIMGFSEFSSNFSRILGNSELLEKYFEFMNLKDVKPVGTLPVEKRVDNEYELEVKDVSFKYPGTDEYALKNVNLKLSIGKKVAIVGMNGSGKTTLIKLLSRLYDPTEGEILLNGIDIKKYDYNEYLNLFSVVFQDFSLFSFDLAQNVAASTDYDEKNIHVALKQAGFSERYDKFKNGLKTSLYQDFDKDGVEISGGEAQKIAMARALYKDSPIIILDEPTAALDPISEFKIYANFNEIVGNKTAIYISHRLSSCRFCDEIIVFDKGKMIQRGGHDHLIKDLNGKYYELWNAQAQYYAEEEVEEWILT
ncbi:ABC transporter ATP-binding protein [Marinilactibacillus sp. GCM10026970]|uniref:ABC transporter ATP-binding protein n=1 Tax=Marinilactibacillus sp. GCM10026970 TaxID=3252642 RepID=UPI003605ED91